MIRRLVQAMMVVALAATPALGQSSPAVQAKLAIEKLDAAARALTNAPKARDRVRALIKTVQAYEAGLDALRAGLRQTALQQDAIRADLIARDQRLTSLLGALMVQQQSPQASVLLHPSGPLATVHAGMLMSDAAPALQRDAAELRGQLRDLQQLQSIQTAAFDKLTEGLRGAQQARSELSIAVAERGELPRRFTADAEAMRLLLDSSETLEGFATALSVTPAAPNDTALRPFERMRGVLNPPVRGTLLRGFNQKDAAGIARPGIILTTAPQALVTAPAAATVRYRGPLLDYGNVLILEPQKGYLLVLAGLGEVFVDTGQVVPDGYAVALMGGKAQITQGFEQETQQGGGNPPTETLYIELRDGNSPVDPTAWFKVNKD